MTNRLSCYLIRITGCLALLLLGISGPVSAAPTYPTYSTEANPVYYGIKFTKAGLFLRYRGDEGNSRRVVVSDIFASNSVFFLPDKNQYVATSFTESKKDSCCWAFIDYNTRNSTFLVMTKPMGPDGEVEYLTVTNGWFATTKKESDASRMKFVASGNSLQLQRSGQSSYMNQWGGATEGVELGEWTGNGDPNNLFVVVKEADIVPPDYSDLVDQSSSTVAVKHKDSYYFTRIDNDPSLEAAARENGFLSATNPRRVTEHNYQNVNVREREVYVKPGETVRLLMPNYMGANDSRSNVYQRWYDYETDGSISGAAINFDGVAKKLIAQQNGIVLGVDLSGTACGKWANFYMPEGEKDTYVVACDMSRYSDFTKASVGNGIDTEPTLDARAIYRICDARIMADSLESLRVQNKWLEDEEIHFPARVNCRLFDQTLPLKLDGRNYYVYQFEEIVHLTPRITLEDPNGLGIELVSTTLADDSHLIRWHYPALSENSVIGQIKNATDTEEDYVIIKVTAQGKDRKNYNIARYKVYFDASTEPRPISVTLGNRASSRTPEYYRRVAGEPEQQRNYDFAPVSYSAPSGNRQTANSYGLPMPYANISYGFSSILSETKFDGDDTSWGEYAVVKKMKAEWSEEGHRTIFKDISTLYYDWYKENGTDEEKAIYCKEDKEATPGYFAYIDASERPGTIATIPLSKNLCVGSKIYVSAWLGSGAACYKGNVSQGAAGVDTDRAPASISFKLVGYKGEETTMVYSFCPGQITGFWVENVNGTDVYHSPGDDEPGVWKHVAFSLTVRDSYDRFQMLLMNNCLGSNGGDILLDDVAIYTISPVIDMEEIAPVCDGNVQFFKIAAEFESVISSMGRDEVLTTEDSDYSKFDCYYCFIDKEMFDKNFLNPDGSRPAYTAEDHARYDEDFSKLVIGDVNAPVGDPTSAFHLFHMSNVYKDREEFSLKKAMSAKEEDCFWEDVVDEQGELERRNVIFTSQIISDRIKANKNYYIIFRPEYIVSGNGTVAHEDYIPPSVFFNMLDDCVVKDEFPLQPSLVTKVDGEIIRSDSISYCTGSVPVIKLTSYGFGESGVIVHEDDRYDWYIGPMEELRNIKVTENGTDYDMVRVLKNFRHYYPDQKSAEGVAPRTEEELFLFTEAMRDKIVELSAPPAGGGEPKLILYHNAINYAIGPDKGEEYRLVAVPCEDEEMSEDNTELFCYEPKEFIILARADSPEGLTGVPGSHYPADFGSAPLRVSLSQIAEMTVSGGHTLTIPFRFLHGSNDEVHGFRVGDDPNVYVVETNDSSYPLYVHDDIENEDFLNPIGTFKSLVAEIGDGAQSADNHAVVQFDDSFAPKEGHTYTLRLSYHEVSDNAENSGCGGHFLFDLKIVPDYLVWTGDAGNSDWNNDSNWRRADRTDLLAAGDSYKDYLANADNYPDKDGVPSDRPCFAPLNTSSVIVPAGLARYPVLTTRYAPATEADLNPDNPQPDTETADIRYDMMADCVDDKGQPSAEFRGVTYYANRCENVHFGPGGQMLNTELLDYGKAWVEYELNFNRWYTLGTPLQDMYSGDWYAPADGARQDTPCFESIVWDAGRYDRFGPAVYQQGWDKTQANVYRLESSTHVNFGPSPWNVAVMADWSNVYNDVAVPYDLNAFSVKVVPLKATHAGPAALFRFPKADTGYSYYTYDKENPEPELTPVPRTASYRLYTDLLKAGRDGSFGQTLRNEAADNNYFLVGNPFVSGMDMNAFFDANTDLERKYYIVADDTQTAYVKDDDSENWVGSDGTLSQPRVAPLQGFFVKKKSTASGAANELQVEFNAGMAVLTGGDTPLLVRPKRGGTVARKSVAGLVITARRDGETGSALLACSPEAADGYVPDEEVELLLDGHLHAGPNRVPAVYTVADGRAMSINRVRGIGCIGIGVAGADCGDVTLGFDGVENLLDEVSLYDAQTGTAVPLRSGMEIEVPGNSAGRYYLMGTSVSPESGTAAVTVSVMGHDVTVKTAAGDRLSRVRVFDAGGRSVYLSHPDADTHTFRLEKGVYVIETVTENNCIATKVLVG